MRDVSAAPRNATLPNFRAHFSRGNQTFTQACDLHATKRRAIARGLVSARFIDAAIMQRSSGRVLSPLLRAMARWGEAPRVLGCGCDLTFARGMSGTFVKPPGTSPPPRSIQCPSNTFSDPPSASSLHRSQRGQHRRHAQDGHRHRRRRLGRRRGRGPARRVARRPRRRGGARDRAARSVQGGDAGRARGGVDEHRVGCRVGFESSGTR